MSIEKFAHSIYKNSTIYIVDNANFIVQVYKVNFFCKKVLTYAGS